MTKEKEKLLNAIIVLLQEECSCLRSVVYENEPNPDHYVQWNRANKFRETREDLQCITKGESDD